MAWLRSAVSKAVEVGNNNSLIRNVVNQAGQAVAEGAKLLQDRIGGKNVRSFKQAMKRLEEASISCRARERAELMRRWVAVLKEIEKSSGYSGDGDKEQHKLPEDQKESPRRQSMVLYYDADMGSEPVNFRDLFLYSQALEGISICMELTKEISGLEKQRDDLEAQLKKVNNSLSSAKARLRDATEERDQFFKANDDIVAHLTTKEHELKRSVGSCQVEADVLSAWTSFLEDTWSLQSSYVGAKDKETSAELEKHEDYFTDLVKQLLSSYEKELRPPIDRIGKYVKNLKNLTEGISSPASNVESNESQVLSPKRNLEEEYLDYESKIITTFSVVDNMREQFYAHQGKITRKEDSKIKELFENLEKLRSEFEAIERPTLDIENPTRETGTYPSEKPHETPATSAEQPAKVKKEDDKPHKTEQTIVTEDDDDDLSKLESEFGDVDRNYTSDEIGGWEFDELERDLKAAGESSIK